MSKSKGNVVDPESYFATHGADALRLYILFMAPPSDGNDDEWTYIYHAATTKKSGKYISSGGRVVSVTGISHSLEDALRKSYESIKKINLEGSHYRSDIGQRALRKR